MIFRGERHYFSPHVPKTFSPNGNGINDPLQVFIEPGVQIQEFIWRVFDRWGNTVYESLDLNGALTGELMTVDVYVDTTMMGQASSAKMAMSRFLPDNPNF